MLDRATPPGLSEEDDSHLIYLFKALKYFSKHARTPTFAKLSILYLIFQRLYDAGILACRKFDI